MTAATDLKSVRERVKARVVGRERELDLVLAAVAPVPGLPPELYGRLTADAVALTRATRAHEDIRQGSSVRGAIDLTLVAGQLLALNTQRAGAGADPETTYRDAVYDAMTVALSGRIFLDETVAATPEQVLRQIWEDYFFLQQSILQPASEEPG